tara:strand:+ start:543 stop:839 length:297 start_codon:yes stop_codon:yes gene_type:complete
VSEIIGPKLTESRKGDLAEFYAVTWLWDQGYEVFKNAASQGPIDIIAFKNGKTFLIDVKTIKISGSGAKRTKLQKELGVILISFDRQTRKLAWVNHQN